MSNPNQETTSPNKVIKEVAQAEFSAVQPIDPLAVGEKSSLELEQLKTKVEHLHNEVKRANDLHNLRIDYTGRLFWLIVVWLGFVVVYVGLSAVTGGWFKLSDSVLIAFITSSTISVLGLFVLAAKWLFPARSGIDNGTEVKEESPAT